MKSRFTGILTLFMAFMIQFSLAQEKTITGVVTSSEDGLPLPGASVMIGGTARGTQTDLDGKYEITANQGERLVFSFVGMRNQSVTVGESSQINVVLESDIMIEAVQIDAYRKITPRTSVVSAKTIDIEAIEERSNANALQSLQGHIAGVNISAGSGQPGSTPNIIIRGIGSINGDTDPLFVIDGMPVDATIFRTLNPNDIKTFTTLKDAAATSIYGNRGANGVIVITTKRGRFNEDLQFRYTVQTGFQRMQNLSIDLMNSEQLLNFQKYHNQGYGATLEQWQIDQLARNTNTYWSDYFFRTAQTQQHDLSISSGSERSSNYTSLSYLDQQGIFIGSNFKRFNLRNNFSGRTANDKFDYSFNLNMGYSQSGHVPQAGGQGVYFNPFRSALHGLPYISPYDADGRITQNGGIPHGTGPTTDMAPIVLLNSMAMNTFDTDELRLLAGFNANYEIVKNVTAGVNLTGIYTGRSYLNILHPGSILGPFQVDQRADYGGIHTESTNRNFSFNGLYSLGYANTFNEKHNVSLTGYLEYNKQHFNGLGFEQRGLDPRFLGVGASFIDGQTSDPNLPNPGLNRPYIPTINSNTLSMGMLSYFAQGTYDFDQKYSVNATIRRDASFRFVDDYKWGTFWSAGAAWNIDKESFMEDSGFSYLKLRGSYGTNGNQYISLTSAGIMGLAVPAHYGGLSIVRNLYTGTGVGYGGTVGAYPTNIANTDARWETVKQGNIGLDFGVMNDRLQGSVDVYRKLTVDLYNSIPVSWTNATNSISGNVGDLENKGVELDLQYNIFKNQDWNISVNANGSYNKNKILKLHESFEGLIHGGGSTAIAEGQSIGAYYVTRYIGVNPSNGAPLFLDIDGNPTHQLRESDRVFIDKSFIPVWQGGFGTFVSYKGFEFATQWSWMADVHRMNMDYAQLEDSNTVGNYNKTATLLNAWENVGDITSVPVIGTVGGVTHVNATDRYIEDSSFLRLRNISFGYSFSKEQLAKTPFTGVKFFFQGENLLTFSKYRGWDVESGFRGTENAEYPTPKMYTLGATINF